MLDVCLIVEGSYPYVPGAVSRWVSELVTGLSTVRFGVVHVGTGRDLPREPCYPVPDNVEHLVEVFPFEPEPVRRGRRLASLVARLRAGLSGPRRRALAELRSLYEKLLAGDIEGLDTVLEVAAGRGPPHLAAAGGLTGGEALDLFGRLFEAHTRARRSLDRFGAWRATHAPLLGLLRTRVPRAAVYHPISAGTAGLLGAVAAARFEAPLLVTEPGGDDPGAGEGTEGGERDPVRGFVRRAVYGRAAEVVTFSEAGLRLAVRRGAPPGRSRIVPVGIDVPRFAGLRAKGRPIGEKDAVMVATVNPVLPGKDVKTFLRAAKLLVERLDLVDLLVVGRTDEDFAYYRECLLQAQMLGIDRLVRFTGPVELKDLLVDLDCLVLTGATDGEPLALLQAMAAGVPSVVTDAGACREIVEGRTPEDRALGQAGVICPVGDHEALADAVVRCLRDRPFRERLVAAGEARAHRHYRREELQAVYLETYARLGERAARRGAPLPARA